MVGREKNGEGAVPCDEDGEMDYDQEFQFDWM